MSTVLAVGHGGLLSETERKAPTQIVEGARNRQILPLSISQFAVEQHAQNILHTLSFEPRRDADAFYRSAHAGIEEKAVHA